MTDVPPTTPYPTADPTTSTSESRKDRWRRRLTSTAAKLAAGALAILLLAGAGGFAIGHAVGDHDASRGDHGWHGDREGGHGFDGEPRGIVPSPTPPTTAPEANES